MDKTSSSVDNFKNFSQTEKKLANIWRSVFSLSLEQYESLTLDSDFFELTHWCGTFEIFDLEQEINRVFEISVDSEALVENCSVLSKQAKLISDTVAQAKVQK